MEVELGPFVLRERLGVGGMGEVWAADHRETGLPVAVKIITAEVADDPTFREAFRREVRHVATLHHPGVVMVLDLGEVDATASRASGGALRERSPYMVMERASGGSLAEHAPRSFAELGGALLEILAGLGHAHARGVIHRDLKPENVLRCTERDPRPGLKLADFGIAWTPSPDDEDLLSYHAGTPATMAPEQIAGEPRDFGPWTDVFGVGCVAWELATGSETFARKREGRAAALARPGPFVPRFDVPDGFEPWLRRCLAGAPRRRFGCTADAAAALRALDPTLPDPHREPLPSPRLLGAGLGLFALRTVPFTGRRPERAELALALDSVRRGGGPRAVVVRGPSGRGKSRLVAHAAHRAHETGAAHVLRLAHGPTDTGAEGIADAVAGHLSLRGLRLAPAVERAARWLAARDVDDAAALAETIAALAVGDAETALEETAQCLAALDAVVAAEAKDRPVLLVVDDAQWGLASLRFVDALLGRDRPVVALLTVRDEALADRPLEAEALAALAGRRGASELRLGPPSAADRTRLLRELLPMEPALAARVDERTGGNPLFAVQLVGDWAERGALEATSAGWALRPGVATALPRGLGEVWMARVERVLAGRAGAHPDDRIALEIAAALGQRVDAAEHAAACAALGLGDGLDLAGLADALLGARLAEGEPARWAFVHGALREAILLAASDAPSLHRACARVVASPLSAGRHLLAAGEPAAAIDPLGVAVRDELRDGDYHVARRDLELYARAIDEAGLPADDARRGLGLVLEAEVLRGSDEWDRATAALERALATRGAGPDAVVCAALRERGRFERERGRSAEALASFEAAERAAPPGDPALAWRCRFQRAQLLIDLGSFDESRELLSRLLAELDDGPSADHADVWHCLGEIARKEGRHDEQERCYRRCIANASTRSRWMIALMKNSLGELARGRGRLDEAEALYRESYARFEALGSVTGIYPHVNLGLVLTERGLHAEARAVLERALATLTHLGREGLAGAVCISTLPCLAALGDWEAWDRTLARGRELLAHSGLVDPDVVRSADDAGGLAEAAGERARAEEVRAIARAQREALGR